MHGGECRLESSQIKLGSHGQQGDMVLCLISVHNGRLPRSDANVLLHVVA